MRPICVWSNNDTDAPPINTRLTEKQVEEIEKMQKKRGINTRSEFLRQLIYTGWKVEKEVIPTIETLDQNEKVGDGSDPLQEIVFDILPETENEAIELDELREKVKKRADDRVLKLFNESNDIKLTSGGVYHADG